MTAEIVLQIFRFGFLLLLWLFIFAAFRVVRADLFGGRTGRVAAVPPRAAAAGGRKRGQKGPRTLVVTAGPPMPHCGLASAPRTGRRTESRSARDTVP